MAAFSSVAMGPVPGRIILMAITLPIEDFLSPSLLNIDAIVNL
jgi:hypothetical protein